MTHEGGPRTRQEAVEHMEMYRKCLLEAGFPNEAMRLGISDDRGEWGVKVPGSISMNNARTRPFWQACHRATTLIGIPVICFECYLTGTGNPNTSEACTYEGRCNT